MSNDFIVVVFACLLLSACATQDAAMEAQEDRDMARAEAVDVFLVREAKCNRSNHTMIVRRTATRIRVAITKHELDTATCR